jgi:hypothetical protein
VLQVRSTCQATPKALPCTAGKKSARGLPSARLGSDVVLQVRSTCQATPKALPSTIVVAMKRLAALVLVLLSFAVPAQAIAAAPSVAAQQAQDGPAIVIDDSEGIPEGDAWTFRFLVPTLLAITVALAIGLVVWYQRGFVRRYRVSE